MKESQRLARNDQRSTECYPSFRTRVRRVLKALEKGGYRPRIQEAWRSPADQLEAYNSGHSKLRFGFHNVTGEDGTKEALAVDVLDDDHPLSPSSVFLLALAIAARDASLETGILWGLPANLAEGVEAAIAARDPSEPVKVGWDPTHAQVTGVTAAEARAGTRPA